MMSATPKTWATSGCARYHSAKASTSRRNPTSVTPPSRPESSEYSYVSTPVKFSLMKSVDRRNS